MRLIDADALLDKIPNPVEENPWIRRNGAIANICIIVEDMPTIDPVKHGHWHGMTSSKFMGIDEYGEPKYRDGVVYTHRECGFNSIIKHKYCPRCGARMDAEA